MIQQRHDQLLAMLDESSKITIADLCARLNVSIETVRRDLKTLEKQGYLKRVYGGAVLNARPQKGVATAEPVYTAREVLNLEEKRAIAAKAAELINDGDTLAIDLGTTTLEVARKLMHKNNLTVLTNSVSIGMQLLENPTNRIYILGGLLRAGDNSTSGSMCEQSLDFFSVDKLLMGVGGLTVEDGVTDYLESEAQIRKKLVKISKQVIAVADYSKFGVTAFCKICPIERIQALVTDSLAPVDMLQKIESAGARVIVAEGALARRAAE